MSSNEWEAVDMAVGSRMLLITEVVILAFVLT